jgi:hypothetical protein
MAFATVLARFEELKVEIADALRSVTDGTQPQLWNISAGASVWHWLHGVFFFFNM